MELFPTPLAVALSATVGLLLGSFYNVCIYRYISGQNIAWPPSHCPSCSKRLGPLELIPVFSWLVLRGRCAGCGAPIGITYPLVELASGIWAALAAAQFGFLNPVWLGIMAVGGVFIIASSIDLKVLLLPDVLTLPGAVLALGVSTLALDLPWQDALMGAAAGAGSFWLLQNGYRLLRGQEGLGGGDVKLMLMIGALVGWQALPLVVLVAALSALVPGIMAAVMARGSGKPPLIPFGPFLSLGAMVQVMYDLTPLLNMFGPR